MKILNNALVLSVSILGLAGCGGSSGGGGTAPGGGGNNIFTSFSNIPDNGTTNFEGTSRSTSVTSEDDGHITSISAVSGPDDATAAATTENGDLVAISIKAPGANVSFDSQNGDTFEPLEPFVSDGDFILATTANDQDELLIVDSEAAGLPQ
jgi:hypothetical protein